MELFEEGKNSISPLADAMRPETLDDFFGQEHIVGKGRLLRRQYRQTSSPPSYSTVLQEQEKPPWPA